MLKFLSLDDVTLRYPFDIFVTILLFVFLILLSKQISKKYVFLQNPCLNFVFFYIVLISGIPVLLFFLSIIGFDYVVIRYFLWVLILLIFLKFYQQLNELLLISKKFIKKNIFISLLLTSFLLISLLPSIDADSLDYHLGIGIDIVREGKLINRQDWLHFRLAGSGEYLNLLGIIVGSKNFGQILQFSSLLIILLSLFSLDLKKYEKLSNIKNFNLILFSSPIYIVLIYSQKYQILGSSIVFLSLILLKHFHETNSKRIISFICLAISFVISLKHSFLIPGFILFLILIFYSYKKKQLKFTFLNLFFFFTIFSFPYYLKNFIFYGDPISPILEFMKIDKNQNILAFAKSITIAETKLNLKNFPTFVLNFFSPISLSAVFNFFGFPALLIFLLTRFKKFENKYLLFFISTNLFFFLILGQTSIRYYTDIILAVFLICTLNLEYIKNSIIFQNIIKLNFYQSLTIIIINFVIFFVYVPKGFSVIAYNKVLQNYALNFNEILWIEKNTPNGSKILSENIRSNALHKRSFLAQDILKYMNLTEKQLIKTIVENDVDYIILDFPIKKKFISLYDKCSIKESVKTKKFETETRNPLSRYRFNYEMILFKNSCKN